MIQHYKILGLPPTATLKEVKKTFRKKAFQTHPDHNNSPTAKEDYIRLQKAYEYIVDVLTGKATKFERPSTYTSTTSSPEQIRRKKERDKITREYSHIVKQMRSSEKARFAGAAFLGFLLCSVLAIAISYSFFEFKEHQKTLNGGALLVLVVLPIAGATFAGKISYRFYTKRRRQEYRKYKEAIRNIK